MTVAAIAARNCVDNRRPIADGSVVIEVRGAMQRSTVGGLADQVRELPVRHNTSVAVDLCGVLSSDRWLVSALAKAHIAARARGAHLQVIVGDDTTFLLLDAVGFDRIISVFRSRDFDKIHDELIPAPGRSRANEHQLTTDRRTRSQRPNRQLMTA
jgi:anti-anti-sigma regulatory factor